MASHRQGTRLARGAWLSVLACGLGLAAPAWAAETAGAAPIPRLEWSPESAASYAACVDGALRDPEAGFENAIAWRDSGGGPPAKHCVAVALYALGHVAEAAVRLEVLEAEEQSLARPLRSALLGQAGFAWHEVGDLARAEAVLTRALAIDPDDIDALIEQSLVRVDSNDYRAAIENLDRVLTLKADHVDALSYRAAAHRKLKAFDQATGDIERALNVAPDHLPALLERGLLRQQAGDEAGARSDWLRVLELDPESPAADAARHNLERLDVKTE